MKGYVCLFLLFIGTALFAPSKTTPDESAVLVVQRQWLEASQKGNGEALRQIIDESFVGSTPDNHIINKQSLFPSSGSEPMFTNTHFVSLSASVIGDMAVVFGSMITIIWRPCQRQRMQKSGSPGKGRRCVLRA